MRQHKNGLIGSLGLPSLLFFGFDLWTRFHYAVFRLLIWGNDSMEACPLTSSNFGRIEGPLFELWKLWDQSLAHMLSKVRSVSSPPRILLLTGVLLHSCSWCPNINNLWGFHLFMLLIIKPHILHLPFPFDPKVTWFLNISVYTAMCTVKT